MRRPQFSLASGKAILGKASGLYWVAFGLAIVLDVAAISWLESPGRAVEPVAAGASLGRAGPVADTIVFGQTAALGGPAAALGIGMKEGLDAAFNEVNKAGGVNGHKLALISIDDGYEPPRAMAAAKKLIDEDHVFAL